MFQVKVCGVTSVEDALAALAAGADAIGLNFYQQGMRYVKPELAADIVAAIGERALTVGVFVNAAPDEIRRIASRCRLGLVQLHGDEPPSDLLALAGLSVMRAFRVAGELASVERYLDACADLSAMPQLALVDAAVPGHFGGSGKTADWELLAGGRSALRGLPLVLAGGLHAGNVEAAVAVVRPVAVDVASGVEDAPGKKSSQRMQAFVRAAKSALAGLNNQGNTTPSGGSI